ncbi:MAG: hypothetical protein RMK29_09640 [Myxococcales bacterium]|nr:hypothetical protein [Myxococcota bacterium]MDW8281963.1 hypothetical protein [Myxococcales bacterium]
MANKELRGASRREFIRGAFALGAALGWGPARIWDFIARGAGSNALADCTTKGAQNLVLLVGSSGAHGYPHFLWPQPDSFYPGRFSDSLALHFMQTMANRGAVANSFGGALRDAQYSNYVSPPAAPSTGLGPWAAGERYKLLRGVDNMAFRGYRSFDATSRALDVQAHGRETIPSNVGIDKGQNFLVVTRETPWLKYGPKKWITAIDGGGINPFHVTGSHNHYINGDAESILPARKKWSVMAAAAAIQLTRPTIVPVIFVGSMASNEGSNLAYYGNNVPGAPLPAFVANAAGMVDLFNSNAAKAGGALSNPKNAVLFEAYTKGFIGTSKTATLPSFSRGYRTAKLAANLVGLNLSEKLLPNDADRLRYGFTGNTPAKMAALRDSLIVTAKALALGLTSQVVISYFNDDPHNIFSANGQSGTGDNAATVARYFYNVLEAFMDDLMAVQDPFCPGLKLGDNTVIAFIGDTPRTGINYINWNDPTYGGQNRTWIMSNGLLRSGFFGGDRARFAGEGVTSNDHLARGPGEGGVWDLETGDLVMFDTSGRTGNINGSRVTMMERGETAMAAILYAVSRGDVRRISDFYPGKPFPAVQVPVLI